MKRSIAKRISKSLDAILNKWSLIYNRTLRLSKFYNRAVVAAGKQHLSAISVFRFVRRFATLAQF